MRVVAVAVVVVVAVTTATAAAQPAGEPVRSGRALDEVSETTALTLSLGGTVLSAGVLTAGLLGDSDGLTGVGLLGAYTAPSFGHWYAGDYWTGGLGMRLAGTGLVMLGGVLAYDDCPPWSWSDCDAAPVGPALMLGGTAVFVAGAVYDVATAPRAARRRNQELRDGIRLTVAPTLTGRQVGVAVAGQF